MKKLILLLLLTTIIQAKSQTPLPILTDGKVWNAVLCNVWTQYGEGEDVPYTISVCGDTIVNDKVCRKLHFQSDKNSYYGVAYEEDGKVYYYTNENQCALLMDFNLHIGDIVSGGNIEEEDVICVNGVNRRRLTIRRDSDGNRMCWVEGIGANGEYWVDPVASILCEYWKFKSCYENGKEIFVEKDFQSEPVTGVSSVVEDNSITSELYTISGIKIEKPLKNKIYIQNGIKKVGH